MVWGISMGQFFNTKVIHNILSIEEKMFNSLNNISKINDFSDIDFYNDEIDKIKLYYKKEKILISKIPEDIDFYNYLFEILKTTSFGFKNENILVSRFRNILFNNYLTLRPDNEDDYYNEDDFYDDEMFGLKAKIFMRDNLLVEYVKSFENPMRDCDRGSYNIFNKIKFYNIFLSQYLFDFWVKSGFDFDRINFCTDEEAIEYLGLSKDDYYYLLNDTVSECCANLLTTIFSDVKKPKHNIYVQDSFFNFKFLVKKLSIDSLLSIKKEMDEVYFSVGKYGLLTDVIKILESEINERNYIEKDNEEEKISVDSTLFDNIVNLVKLEDKIYDLYSLIDFNSSKNDTSELYKLILLEKDMIEKIDFSPSLITILSDLFSNNSWIYLTGDVNEKGNIILQRLSNLLPFYKDIKVSPSQSTESYNFIYRNHLIRSLSDLWMLKSESEDKNIQKGFEELYKYYYFINPCLTDELLALNGNHSLIFDLPNDLSGIDDLEYVFDQDEQLFDLGFEIISYIFDNEDNINSIIDYCEFQFKINELVDIICNLSDEYNKKLYHYLNNCGSLLSPLRRDIRKIFKENLEINKVKYINK